MLLAILLLGGCTARHEWELSVLQPPPPREIYIPTYPPQVRR
jgi:hypothetical protein